MEVIFLIGAIQSFFLTLLFFGKKRRNQADIFLILWLMAMGFVLLDNYLRNNGFVFENPHFLGLTYCVPMISGPLLFMYVFLLIKKSARFNYLHALHSVPFIFFVTYFLFNFYFLSPSEKLEYFYQMSREPVFMIYTAEFFLVFSGPVYMILNLVLLRQHTRNLKDNFSYTEKINLKWLKFLSAAGIILAIFSLSTNLLSDVIPVIPYWVGDNITYGGITILIFFMGYYGINQPVIYKSISLEEAEETIRVFSLKGEKQSTGYDNRESITKRDKYRNTGLKPEDAQKHMKRLLEFMDTERPYLESTLTLKDVSESLGISTNHLSQIINERLGVNFFDFINNYRVKEVKKCMSNPKFEHYTLLGIALECGFNSKSTFNSIFKKTTNLTPSEFKKSSFA